MTSPVQESFENFENVKFDDFESKDVILDDSKDPNKNFYNNIKAINTQHYFPFKASILKASDKCRKLFNDSY